MRKSSKLKSVQVEILRGACHLRGYTVASEVLGIPEKTDPLGTDGKAGLVKKKTAKKKAAKRK